MKVRIISAIVAIAILSPFIYLGGVYFTVLMGIIGALAYKEILDSSIF